MLPIAEPVAWEFARDTKCAVEVVRTQIYRVPLCGMSEIQSDVYAGAWTDYSGPRA